MTVTAQLNVTPDGFCNHEDVAIDDDFMAFAVDCLAPADRLLLGRITFEMFASYWPAAARDASLPIWEQRLGQAIDGIDRTVASRTLTGTDWPGTAILPHLDEDSARTLARDGHLLIFGSPSIIAQFAGWGLLDTLLLSVHPVLGRRGLRPFDGTVPEGMTCVSDRQTGAGVRTYRFTAGHHG